MTSWAKPGVKCVCVRGGTPLSDGFNLTGGYPVTGGIYTVDGVGRDEMYNQTLLYLVEFPCCQMIRGELRGWDASRFRPLITQSDDVALFKHHLVPQEVEA